MTPSLKDSISPRAKQKLSSAARFLGKFNPFLEVNAMFFKMFVGVLHRSLIRDLLTTSGVYRKLAVRATTK